VAPAGHRRRYASVACLGHRGANGLGAVTVRTGPPAIRRRGTASALEGGIMEIAIALIVLAVGLMLERDRSAQPVRVRADIRRR
jgi:hypothetical protein